MLQNTLEALCTARPRHYVYTNHNPIDTSKGRKEWDDIPQ